MNTIRTVITAAALLALSACTPGDDAGSLAKAGEGCAALRGVDIPGAGTPGSHGEAAREDGAVKVRQDGGQYRASQVVTLSNDFGGASSADVTLDTANGAIVNCVAAAGGYAVRVFLEGRGATEQEARDALATMRVAHGDTLVGGMLSVSTAVRFDEVADTSFLPMPLPVTIGTGNATGASSQRGASIVMGMPASASYALHHGTANGFVEVTGLGGTQAELDSSNGPIFLDGRWDQASLDTSNGPIVVEGDFAELDANTSNGEIAATLATRRSTDASFSSANGGIDVALRRSGDPGFDLTGGTSNGRVRIAVSGTEPVGEPEKTEAHWRTPGYETHAVQVRVDAQTANADVTIRD